MRDRDVHAFEQADEMEQLNVAAADFMTLHRVSVPELLAVSDGTAPPDVEALVDAELNPENSEGSLFDGDFSLPLPNAQHELFLQTWLKVRRNDVAYNAAFPPRKGTRSGKTAKEQGCRLMRREDIRSRLQWLISQGGGGVELPDPGGKGKRSGPMTDEDILEQLEEVIRTAPNLRDRVAAIAAYDRARERLLGRDRDVNDPDPVFVCDYLRRAREQGKTLEDLEREGRQQGESEAIAGPNGCEPGAELTGDSEAISRQSDE